MTEINYDGKDITFTETKNNTKSTIFHFVQDTPAFVEENGVVYVYGYQYSDAESKENDKEFGERFTDLMNDLSLKDWECFNEFLERGIFRFEDYLLFREIKGVIDFGKSEMLSIEVWVRFIEYTDRDILCLCTSVKSLSDFYERIKIDDEQAKEALKKIYDTFTDEQAEMYANKAKKIFEDKKREYKLYAANEEFNETVKEDLRESGIKTDEYQDFDLYKFLKYKEEDDERFFKKLRGGVFLLCSDFYTDKANKTATKAVNILRSIDKDNKVVVFYLIKKKDE